MTETVRRRGRGISRALRLLPPLAVAGVVAAATGVVAVANPHVNQLAPPCVLHQATGLYCPACGGTRAVYDLTQGDLVGALHMNAFVTLVLVPGTVLALGWWIARAAGFNPPSVKHPTAVVWVALSVFAVFAVVRNFAPFAPYLAP